MGLLTVREAAEELGLAEVTVRLWARTGRLGYVKLGTAVRIPSEAVYELILAGTVPRTARAAANATRHQRFMDGVSIEEIARQDGVPVAEVRRSIMGAVGRNGALEDATRDREAARRYRD